MKSVLVLLTMLGISYSSRQTVGVRGQLICCDQPLTDATVKLWDLNIWPDPDEMFSEVHTDGNGQFEIYGTANDLTTMDPTIKFYHRCNNRGVFNIPNLCKRKIAYDIPKMYISAGQNVARWYEMGTLNMEAKQRGEQTKCFRK